MNLDTNTKVKVATGLRRGKKSVSTLFTGCKGENTDGGVTSAPDFVVYSLGIAGFVIAIAAFPLAAGGIVVDLCGSFLVVFAPYVVYQKRVLADLGTFRSLLNMLRGKINMFMEENDKLEANLKRLSSSVDELETIEADFSRLAGSNNVDRLVEVIKETKDTNAQIKKKTESAIVHYLVTVVLNSDTDGNLKISPSEIQDLCTRLGRETRFSFNKERFLYTLGGGKSEIPVQKIMDVIRNLKSQDLTASERIFTLTSTGTGRLSLTMPTVQTTKRK